MSNQENNNTEGPQPTENVTRPTNEYIQNSEDKRPVYIPKPEINNKEE